MSKHSGKGINTSTLSTSLSVCLVSACCSPGKHSSALSSSYANGVQKYAIIMSIHDSEEWERLPALLSQLDSAASQASSNGIFPLRQFPLCQFPLRQFPFGQLPTLSIPILSIPIWSMLTKRELTKWELTKWEVDKVGTDEVHFKKI